MFYCTNPKLTNPYFFAAVLQGLVEHFRLRDRGGLHHRRHADRQCRLPSTLQEIEIIKKLKIKLLVLPGC